MCRSTIWGEEGMLKDLNLKFKHSFLYITIKSAYNIVYGEGNPIDRKRKG